MATFRSILKRGEFHATLCGNTYRKILSNAGNFLEPYKLQRRHEIKSSVNV